VITTKGQSRGRAGYALKAAEKIVNYYNDYFGETFPLPKLDLIALPSGSAARWKTGAASLSSEHLLYAPAKSIHQRRKTSSLFVAH